MQYRLDRIGSFLYAYPFEDGFGGFIRGSGYNDQEAIAAIQVGILTLSNAIFKTGREYPPPFAVNQPQVDGLITRPVGLQAQVKIHRHLQTMHPRMTVTQRREWLAKHMQMSKEQVNRMLDATKPHQMERLSHALQYIFGEIITLTW